MVEEEYIDGMVLSDLLKMAHLYAEQAAAIAQQVCFALSVLHAHEIIHRDVKPENIIITSTGRVVLIDLDAASKPDHEKDTDTRLLGTVGYAAPEQFGFGRSDARTDIFSVGVLMNVLLTGDHPAKKLADGTLTLSGAGAMANFSFYEHPWDTEGTGKAVISDGITRIGDYAFANCRQLQEVEIAPTVQEIGVCVFHSCTSLTEVHIPKGVRSMLAGTFTQCGTLQTVHLPSTLEFLGGDCFNGCLNLTCIDVAEKNRRYWIEEDGCLCGLDGGVPTLFWVPPDVTGTFTVPTSVRSVLYAFFDCTGLKEIIM